MDKKNFRPKVNTGPDNPPKKLGQLFDSASERIILAGVISYGESALYEVLNFVNTDSFVSLENQAIFKAISDLVINEKIGNPSVPSIIAYLNQHSYEFKIDIDDYLQAIILQKVSKQELALASKRVGRCKILRNAKLAVEESLAVLENASFDKPIAETLAEIEKPIMSLHNDLTGQIDSISISSHIDILVEKLTNQDAIHFGIPTGLPGYDSRIGRGLRPGVHMLAARAKAGKSMFAMSVAANVVKEKIPVLYLDTELDMNTTMTRLLANISQVTIDDLETGKFAENDFVKNKVIEGASFIKNNDYLSYENISGKRHGEWIRAIRQWIYRKVSFNAEGKANPCLVILDYLKMMDSKEMGQNMREDQLLGQAMTDLQNFALQFGVAILSFAQLNRDGINNSTEASLAGSDKITWFCSSFSIFRKKDDEDLAADPAHNGTRKLVVVLSRFGPGHEQGEYINIKFNPAMASIKEGPLNTLTQAPPNGKKKTDSGIPNIFDNPTPPEPPNDISFDDDEHI